MKIHIDTKSKINNPAEFIEYSDPAFIKSFVGDFDERFFKDSDSKYESYLKHQVSNLDVLKNSLNNINLQMEYIWLIIFRNNDDRISSSFIVKTNTNNEGLTIFWRKYMSKSEGSGQNELFIVRDDAFVQEGCVNKIKVKLTDYLKHTNLFLESL